MIQLGRLCVKTAGRDAMQLCVVVEEVDEKYVIVDGNTRRKKVNKLHLEPLNKILDIKKGADRKAVIAAFEAANIEVKERGEPRNPKEQVKKVEEKKKPSTTKKKE